MLTGSMAFNESTVSSVILLEVGQTAWSETTAGAENRIVP